MLSTTRALLASSHPGPTVAVTLLTVLVAVGAGLEPWRIVVLGLALLFDQLSVGLSNDWIDAERDRALDRADKPIAQGAIPVTTVRTAAFVALGLALALTVPLGWLAVLVHGIALASAWSYNAWLKNTPVSVLPFILSFGLLPLIVTLSRADVAVAAPWVVAAGAMLGIAAHFSNVLPDFERDRLTGIRGLPHRMGRRASGVVIALALAAASALVLFGPAPDTVPWIPLSISSVLAIASLIAALAAATTRWLFRLIIAAAVVDVVLLVWGGVGIVC